MDSFDLNTRLPPRKRLLAGLRKETSDADFSLPPLPPGATGLYARRLHALLDSPASSPDEIVEASRSAALAADEVAARARAIATEKAAAAAKARATARNALELLYSVTGRRDLIREGRVAKGRVKKKHVPVKLLYNNKKRGEVRRTDEEVARRLHHTMNSSPRISGNLRKKRRRAVVSDDSSVRNENSAVLRDGEDRLVNGYCADGSGEKVVQDRGDKDKGSVGIKKLKGRPKRVLLSQCNMRNQGKPEDEAPSKGPKLDSAQRSSPLGHTKPSGGGEVPMKILLGLKCKKFKVPLRSSSDGKISHSLCLDPAAPKATEMVKVD